MLWSPKQRSFIKHSTAFINVADGAVRSGKTHSNLIAFAAFCAQGPPGDLGVFGRTERTVKRNVVYPLIQGLPKGTVKYVQGSGEVYVYGRRCWIFGANDVRAEEKVQGSTLAGGYMNEVTLYPESLVDHALARSMTILGSRWFLDCNPDSPYHWLNQKYLSAGHRRAYLKRWRFRLDDNPILPQANVEMLKALYGPGTLFYRRNIDGEWVIAEGVVYPMLDVEPGGAHVTDYIPIGFDRVVVGVDYGTATVTTFVMMGRDRAGVWHVFKEYYHDAEKAGWQKTDAEFSEDFRAFLGGWHPQSIEVDPSVASFKRQLKNGGIRGVRDADNSVVDGIRTVSTALTGGKLKIHASCENLLREMAGYVWDKDAQNKGEDRPVKRADHTVDALRYACVRVLSRPDLRVLDKPAGL